MLSNNIKEMRRIIVDGERITDPTELVSVTKTRDPNFLRCESLIATSEGSTAKKILDANVIQAFGFAEILNIKDAEITYTYVKGKDGGFGDTNIISSPVDFGKHHAIVMCECVYKRLDKTSGSLVEYRELYYAGWLLNDETSRKYDVWVFNEDCELVGVSVVDPTAFRLGKASNMRWVSVLKTMPAISSLECVLLVFANCSYWYENEAENDKYISDFCS